MVSDLWFDKPLEASVQLSGVFTDEANGRAQSVQAISQASQRQDQAFSMIDEGLETLDLAPETDPFKIFMHHIKELLSTGSYYDKLEALQFARYALRTGEFSPEPDQEELLYDVYEQLKAELEQKEMEQHIQAPQFLEDNDQNMSLESPELQYQRQKPQPPSPSWFNM